MTTPTTKLDYAHPTLRREIELFGAVMLGLGSILGTGVFVSLAHATELAGPWVLLAIVLAGLLAYCNAMSSAQLAAAYPVSGGTYEYGYRVLNPVLGFTAGWMFLLAKSASAATAALSVVSILHDGRFHLIKVPIGAGVLISLKWFGTPDGSRISSWALLMVLVGTVLLGLRRTIHLNAILLLLTIVGLLCFFVSALGAPVAFAPISGLPTNLSNYLFNGGCSFALLLQATALSFVAFTGYGRLATMGEEITSPRRNLPLAILVTIAVAMIIYLATGFSFVLVESQKKVIDNTLNFTTVMDAARFALLFTPGAKWWMIVISLAAVTAMLGVLLNLILGLSRVWLAMGRRGDMPRILARVNEKTSTPVPATILTGIVIALLVLVGDVRTTWSFSAFTVLIYYAITNLACLRLAPEHRRYPRALAWIGLFACLSLAWFVEMKVWIAGTILIGVGLVWFWIRCRVRNALPGPPSTANLGT